MLFNKIHHVAVICSDYQQSKTFYVEKLGLEVVQETYREQRDSYKLDLAVGGQYQIELFYFPDRPARPSFPEARGLRHLAFEVDNVEETATELNRRGIATEPIRVDEITGRKFTFFADPDDLPLEIYEH
jgi:glyoxylase I family protein